MCETSYRTECPDSLILFERFGESSSLIDEFFDNTSVGSHYDTLTLGKRRCDGYHVPAELVEVCEAWAVNTLRDKAL